MVLSTAACITGLDAEEARALYLTRDGMKNEIIVHRAGGWVTTLPSGRPGVIGGDRHEQGAAAADLEAAITGRTAAIFVFYKNL